MTDDDAKKNEILAEYKGEKEMILNQAEPGDYDRIIEKEFKKYEKMNTCFYSMPNLSEEEKSFACEIKFYIDPDINYYEKDKWSRKPNI